MIRSIGEQDLDCKQLMVNSFDTILILEDYKIVYISNAGFDLFGFKYPMEVIGKSVGDLIHADHREQFLRELKKVMDGKQIDFMEYRMLNSYKEPIDVDILAAPYNSGDQKMIQIRIRDITKRKNTERIVRNLEKLSAIGEMAAGIAHEVRNPLTAVKGFLQLIQKNFEHTYFPIINEELDSAIRILNHLLLVSKPDFDNEPDTEVMLCSDLESLLFLFQEKLYNVEVVKKLSDCDKGIQGKRNPLFKAFFNIMKNAVESISGKGKLTLEHYYKDESIHVKIIDTGKGIPEEKVKLLGTPFYTTKINGNGMGLTQVFTAVHRHSGQVFIESEVDKGTMVHVVLPGSV